MKRTASILLAALALSGCSGLNTTWRLQLQMIYQTPEDAPAAPAPVAADPKKAT